MTSISWFSAIFFICLVAATSQASFPSRSLLTAETVESEGARGLGASGFATGKTVQNNLKKKKSGRSAETGEDTEREAISEQYETRAREGGEEDMLSTDDVFLSDIIYSIMYVVDSLGGGNLVRSRDDGQATRMEAVESLLTAETVQSEETRGLGATGFATGKAAQNMNKKKSGRSLRSARGLDNEAVVEQYETSAREAGEEDTLSTDDIFLSDIISFIMYVVDSLGGGNLVRSLDYEQAARMEALKPVLERFATIAREGDENDTLSTDDVFLSDISSFIMMTLDSIGGGNLLGRSLDAKQVVRRETTESLLTAETFGNEETRGLGATGFATGKAVQNMNKKKSGRRLRSAHGLDNEEIPLAPSVLEAEELKAEETRGLGATGFATGKAAQNMNKKKSGRSLRSAHGLDNESLLTAETFQSEETRGLGATGFATGKAAQNMNKKKSGRSLRSAHGLDNEFLLTAETFGNEETRGLGATGFATAKAAQNMNRKKSGRSVQSTDGLDNEASLAPSVLGAEALTDEEARGLGATGFATGKTIQNLNKKKSGRSVQSAADAQEQATRSGSMPYDASDSTSVEDLHTGATISIRAGPQLEKAKNSRRSSQN